MGLSINVHRIAMLTKRLWLCVIHLIKMTKTPVGVASIMFSSNLCVHFFCQWDYSVQAVSDDSIIYDCQGQDSIPIAARMYQNGWIWHLQRERENPFDIFGVISNSSRFLKYVELFSFGNATYNKKEDSARNTGSPTKHICANQMLLSDTLNLHLVHDMHKAFP